MLRALELVSNGCAPVTPGGARGFGEGGSHFEIRDLGLAGTATSPRGSFFVKMQKSARSPVLILKALILADLHESRSASSGFLADASALLHGSPPTFPAHKP